MSAGNRTDQYAACEVNSRATSQFAGGHCRRGLEVNQICSRNGLMFTAEACFERINGVFDRLFGRDRWHHMRCPCSSSTHVRGKFPCDTQVSTFVAGHILFHAFSTTFAGFSELGQTEWNEIDTGLHYSGMNRIWPPPTRIIWTAHKEMTSDDAIVVANTLRNLLLEGLGGVGMH